MKDAKAIITRNMSKRNVLQQPIVVPRELMKNINYGETLEYYFYLVQCVKAGSRWEDEIGSFSDFLKQQSKKESASGEEDFHVMPPLEMGSDDEMEI